MSPAKKRAKTPGIARIKKLARSVNRKTLKVKRNAVHINHGIIEENCIMCVKGKPTDETNVGAVCKNGHVWLSLCEEFFEVLEDSMVMEEVREVMMKAKTKKG